MSLVYIPTRGYGRFHVPAIALPDGATPTECETLLLSQVDRRQVNCAHQTTCCTHAASKSWKGFHCLDCNLVATMSPLDQRRDFDGLTLLLAAISARQD